MNGTKTPNSRDEQDSAYNPGDLRAAERFPGAYSSSGIDKAEKFANDPANATNTSKEPSNSTKDPSANINNVKDQEQNLGWKSNFSGHSEKRKFNANFLKKKGPMGLIITLLIGGGGGLSLLLSPSLALIHIKEIVIKKVDTMSEVVDERAMIALKSRAFSTTASCKIKVKCRFKGLTKTQMAELRNSGAEIVDKDGKPITKNKLGRYTGGRTLVMPDGQKISASKFRSELRRNSDLRDLTYDITKARSKAWRDPVAKLFLRRNRVPTNPKWADTDDEKKMRRGFHASVSGQSYDAKAVNNQEYEKNEDGEKVKKQGSNIDYGPVTEDINYEAEKLAEKAANGEKIEPLPNDPAGAAAMDDYKSGRGISGKDVLNKTMSFLNPLSILTGVCTTYQIANIIIIAHILEENTTKIRTAYSMAAVAGKVEAGNASPREVENVMNIYQREDDVGDNFGDSVGYHWAEYGTVPSKPITSSANGNSVIQVMSDSVGWINDHLGGGATVHTTCNVLTNPFVAGALSLTSFIPGAGQAAKAVTGVLSKIAKQKAENMIKESIVNGLKKTFTKAGVKAAAKKAANSKIFKMAKSAAGIFVASYIIGKYGIPYLARLVESLTITSDMNGPKAMDTTVDGLNNANASIARKRGLVALDKDSYEAFNRFQQNKTAQYVADRRANSNPFDMTDPYSMANTLAFSYYMFASNFNIFGNKASGILSIPSAILSNLNPASIITSPAAAKANDGTDYCQDEYLNSHNVATTPFCYPVYGFPDIEMLKNTTQDEVITWMLQHGYIDDNGDPVPDTKFAEFKSKCIDPDDKYITDAGDETNQLDEMCYGDENMTYEFKMFHLYVIDGNLPAGAEESADQTTGTGKWVNPADGNKYVISSPFGDCGNRSTCHEGIDLAYKGNFASACDGTIKSIGNHGDSNGRDGSPDTNIITIDCGDGITTKYMHYFYKDLTSKATVGAKVAAGTVLGITNNQGNSTGTHLHFQVEKNGNPIDPKPFMQSKGVNL